MIAEYSFLHTLTTVLCIILPTCVVCIGQAVIAISAVNQCRIQPSSSDEIQKCVTLGLIIIETAALMGLVMAMMLLMKENTFTPTYLHYLAELGIACALPITGALAGYASIQTIKNSCKSIARQPFFAQKIKTSMLITTSLLQSSVLFGCIIALLIKSNLAMISSINESIVCIFAGVTIALGSIGPTSGLSAFGGSLCTAIGLNRDAYQTLFSFALIAQALIEASLIFTLIVALSILNSIHTVSEPWAIIAAALAIGVGTIAPALASGRVASHACLSIARTPSIARTIMQMSILTQAIIETASLYAAIIAFFLISNS